MCGQGKKHHRISSLLIRVYLWQLKQPERAQLKEFLMSDPEICII